MFEQVKAAIEAASALAEVPRQRAERIARDITGRMGLDAGIKSLADQIIKRSRENAGMMKDLVESEIRRQVRILGLATRDDIERIGRRLDRIERREAPVRKAKPKVKPPAS